MNILTTAAELARGAFTPKARSTGAGAGPNFLGREPQQFTRPVPMNEQQRRTLFMACSVLLDYPEDSDLGPVQDAWTVIAENIAEVPEVASEKITTFIRTAQAQGLRDMQKHYVETFDQRRKCSMFLSYYSVGDTRQRGTAILAFKQQLDELGLELNREELPDHLCVVLEAAAKADGEEKHRIATEMLASHRDGLEVLRTALNNLDSPYAQLIEAVCMALPDVDQDTADSYLNLIRSGPPAELVGLGTPLPFGGQTNDGRESGHTHGLS